MDVIREGTVKRQDCLLRQEDWTPNWPSLHNGADVIAAYPVSKESHYYGSGFYCYPRRGEKFRLEMRFPDEQSAAEEFELLQTGERGLEDYQNYYYLHPGITAADMQRCIGIT